MEVILQAGLSLQYLLEPKQAYRNGPKENTHKNFTVFTGSVLKKNRAMSPKSVPL